jgi:hypothetical protein
MKPKILSPSSALSLSRNTLAGSGRRQTRIEQIETSGRAVRLMDEGKMRQPRRFIERDGVACGLDDENRHSVLDRQAVASIGPGANDLAAIRDKDPASPRSSAWRCPVPVRVSHTTPLTISWLASRVGAEAAWSFAVNAGRSDGGQGCSRRHQIAARGISVFRHVRPPG